MNFPDTLTRYNAERSARRKNNFYDSYLHMCLEMGTPPLRYLKPHDWNNQTVLDLRIDRIRKNQWDPILSALQDDTSLTFIAFRCHSRIDFLQDVDPFKQASFLRSRVAIYTTHILDKFLESLRQLLEKSQAINCLELEGIPVSEANMILFLKALEINKSLKILSIKHCNLRNLGCESICEYIRNSANIEVLNLSSCNLGQSSAKHICNLIRFQQVNHRTKLWPITSVVNQTKVGGLKHIVLNCNPKIEDRGLQYILEVLKYDNCQIQSIEMQQCGLTEDISEPLLVAVASCRSLNLANFYSNEKLSKKTCDEVTTIVNSRKSSTASASAYDKESLSATRPAPTNMKSPTELYELNRKLVDMSLGQSQGVSPPPNYRAIIKTYPKLPPQADTDQNQGASTRKNRQGNHPRNEIGEAAGMGHIGIPSLHHEEVLDSDSE